MEKISLFGLTFGHKRSCDSVMGGPIFANLVSKYARGFKEKSHEIAWREVERFSVHGEICLGGGLRGPPPVQLGLSLLLLNPVFEIIKINYIKLAFILNLSQTGSSTQVQMN